MPNYVNEPRSLFPEWLAQLTLQQQAVLMAATRGQDGDPKYTKMKEIMWTLRACTMKAAHLGRMLNINEHVPSFMTLRLFAHVQQWHDHIKAALEEEGDGAVLHYYTHLMHGAQILAYKHPDPAFRERWIICYEMMVHKLHLNSETEAEMDHRLGDWDRNKWEKEAPHGWVCYNAGPGMIYWSERRDQLEHELTEDLKPATAYEKALFQRFGVKNMVGYQIEPEPEGLAR